ncbi:D-isomer specific 2-hydroxyacid dehydrogenase [Macleaya cordata]|uniref:D-isomer specific 2-hydroxyacid dehydrogenase n=1 Tax=Macleaya cordata TaxID=56857 RepID=A0A200PZW1_MACCD|nr:D-isomer specific 2-hydroxyacid dehydrogenase [Macleaya cordata]
MVENTNSDITRVLFCGPHFPASHNYTREYLQNYPFVQVDDVPLDDVSDVIANYHICVVKNRRLDSEVIGRATRMKLIMQFGVGLEASCAEMAIYLMLGLLRKQKEMEVVVKQKRLGEPTGETLLGKTVYIMGFGNIGIDLAKHLRPFGVKILATKRTWPMDSRGSSLKVMALMVWLIRRVVQKEADIVVPCLLLNSETVSLIFFLTISIYGSLLVNIARGGLLDYDAVASYLESGHLGGLGIDVAWTEPFNPDDPILKFQNILITPRVAGMTEYSYRTMAQLHIRL